MKYCFLLTILFLVCACAADTLTVNPPVEPEPGSDPELPWTPNEFCIDPDSLTGCEWIAAMTEDEVRELLTGKFYEYHTESYWTGPDTSKMCGDIALSLFTLDFREDGTFKGTFFDSTSTGTWTVGMSSTLDAGPSLNAVITQETGNIVINLPSRACDDNYFFMDARSCCDWYYILYRKVD